MTNPPTNFLKYAGTPFEPFILPIIPAGVELKKDSSLTAAHLGKIPGKWYPQPNLWSGFYGWQSHWANANDLERWQRWQGKDKANLPIASGLRTGLILAMDIDVNQEDIARDISSIIHATLGVPGAIRRRHGSSRQVLLYAHRLHTMPVTKQRISFRIKETGEECALEVLGEGQQVVIEGPHAKGAMHYWENDVDPIKGLDRLTSNLLVVDDIAKMMSQVRIYIEGNKRLELIKAKLPSGMSGERATAVSIEDIASPHHVKGDNGLDLLARAVAAIDINSDKLADYDAWVTLFRAIKAACGGDMTFYTDNVEPWLMRNDANAASDGEARMLEKWNSFHDSELGADYVFNTAAAFGFTEGLNERAVNIFENRPVEAIQSGTPADGGNASTDAAGGGAGGTVARRSG